MERVKDGSGMLETDIARRCCETKNRGFYDSSIATVVRRERHLSVILAGEKEGYNRTRVSNLTHIEKDWRTLASLSHQSHSGDILDSRRTRHKDEWKPIVGRLWLNASLVPDRCAITWMEAASIGKQERQPDKLSMVA